MTACSERDAPLREATQARGERDIVVLAQVRENIRVEANGCRMAARSGKFPCGMRRTGSSRCGWSEIQAQGVGPDGKAFTLRLWRTLSDSELYPAEDLPRHYVMRWGARALLPGTEAGCT